MKYIQEYGKKITHPHVIQIRGDAVWDLYCPNAVVPFDPWIMSHVRDWLNELPLQPKYSWMPQWSPWQPTIPAWETSRPYTSMLVAYSSSPTNGTSVANIRFVRKEDAMKFKLVWA